MAGQPVAGEVEQREPTGMVGGGSVVPPPMPWNGQRSPTILSRIRSRMTALVAGTRTAIILEHERGNAALLTPLAMGAGAMAYFRAPFEPGWASLLLWLVALAVISAIAWSRLLLRMLFLGAAFAVSGAAFAKLEVVRADTKVLGSEISTHLTGHVVDIDHLASGRVRFLIDVIKTERPLLRYQPTRVRVSAGSPAPDIVAGSLVSGPVKLHPPSGPVRPGGFDFSFESYFDGLGANGYFLAAPRLVPGEEGRNVRAWLDNARNKIAGRIRSAIAGPEGEIAAALIVGVRAGIPENVNESLRRTGLAHILSISGLHMALVAAIIMGSIRWTLALFPDFASRRSVKKYAAAGALVLVAAYLLISGAEIAAQRSFVMLAIMLVAVLMDRRALSMRNLAIAALVVLVMSPHEIIGPSFQMSFAATAALVGAYGIWAGFSRPASAKAHAPRSIFAALRQVIPTLFLGTVVTALVAGLATTIFGVWHFQRVSPLSLLANLLVSPVVSLVVMPFAVLAVVAMPFGFDVPFLGVMGMGLTVMLAVSNWISDRSPVDAVGLISGHAVLWFTAALLAATLPTTRLRWTAVVFVAVGLWTMRGYETPQVLVSEDARLVAVRSGEGRLLLNRRQANSFILDGWKRALMAEEVIAPVAINGGTRRTRIIPSDGSSHSEPDSLDLLLADVSTRGFVCADGLCLAEHDSGSIIAVSANQHIPLELCYVADLIVVQAPMETKPCRKDGPAIIDARLLARRGAAAVSFSQVSAREFPATTINYALSEPYRPWHTHRAYSRAARGMAPYVPRPRRNASAD